MPFDETQEILCEKKEKVQMQLAEHFSYEIKLARLDEAGILNPREYIPSLKIVCFLIETDEMNKVYSCLKSALYSKNNKKASQIDRFQLKRHGCVHP